MINKLKIFIVDDDIQYLKMIKQTISSRFQNAKIKTFSNPDDFLFESKKNTVDLFIVDIKLKNSKGFFVDGRDLCMKLPRSSINTPFLFISGYTIGKEMFWPQYKNHIYDFVEKTQNSAVLLNRISILLKIASLIKVPKVIFPIKGYNHLSGKNLRKYWENIIVKDRLLITHFVSQIGG